MKSAGAAGRKEGRLRCLDNGTFGEDAMSLVLGLPLPSDALCCFVLTSPYLAIIHLLLLRCPLLNLLGRSKLFDINRNIASQI